MLPSSYDWLAQGGDGIVVIEVIRPVGVCGGGHLIWPICEPLKDPSIGEIFSRPDVGEGAGGELRGGEGKEDGDTFNIFQ